MKKEYSEKIPVIQFLMLLEVMLYHLELMPVKEPINAFDLWLNELNFNIIWGELTQLCMAWFFGIQGLFLFLQHRIQHHRRKLCSSI